MDVFDDADVQRVAEAVQQRGLKIGSFVAPVWPGTVGASAMGPDAAKIALSGLDIFKSSIRQGVALGWHSLPVGALKFELSLQPEFLAELI